MGHASPGSGMDAGMTTASKPTQTSLPITVSAEIEDPLMRDG